MSALLLHHVPGLDPGGQPGHFTMIERELSDSLTVSVNVASGNLMIESADLEPTTQSYGVEYGRTYNSSDTSAGILGVGWSLDVDPDVRVQRLSASVVVLHAPDGAEVELEDTDADGVFEGPMFNGVLRAESGGGYRLERIEADEDYLFDASGDLVQVETFAGTFTVQRTSAAGKTVLSSYGTTDGRRINVSYDGTSKVRLIDDPASRHRYYRYDAAGRLREYESPSGVETYDYDAAGRLVSVVAPTGSTASIAYTVDGRVSSLVVTRPDGQSSTTSLSYAAAGSTQALQDGSEVTYEYGDDLFVHREVAGQNPPDLTLDGPLYQARGTMLAGGQHGLAFSASGGLGALNVLVEVADWKDPYPHAAGTWDLRTSEYREGRYIIEVTAADGLGNRRTDAFWVDVPAPTFSPSDGLIPGDEEEILDSDIDIEPGESCDEYYGAQSPYCERPVTATARVAAGFKWGLSEDDNGWANNTVEKPIFTWPAFTDLNTSIVRRVVAWNIVKFDSRRKRFRAWYEKAIDADQEILVSFQLGCNDDLRPYGACYREQNDPPESGLEAPPKRKEWVKAVRGFRKRFPQVRYISSWNEPNHHRQPLQIENKKGGGPDRAAWFTYWLERYVCKDYRTAKAPCDIIAGDFYGEKLTGEHGYTKRYIAKLGELFKGTTLTRPTIWGFHPYSEIYREPKKLSTTGTRRLLRKIPKGDVLWLTEGGSRIDHHYGTTADQRRRTKYYVTQLPKIDRVAALFYYSLCPGDDNWDSGLFERTTAPKPEYCGADKRPAYEEFRTRGA